MDSLTFFSTLILVALLAALAGGWAVYLRLQRRLSDLAANNTSLNVQLEMERQNQAEKLATLKQAGEQQITQLKESFSHLSSQALQHNNEAFLKLAQENLQKFQTQARGELGQREQAIEGLVKPIREALEKTQRQIQELEQARKQAYGSLTQQLEGMARAQQSLESETRNLVKAFSRPEIRGQWGELTLRRLAELAGMVEHCDFFEQAHTATEDGALRPDMIVRLPGGREIVVDVKTPLDAYLCAVEAADDGAREQQLTRHTRNVRQRVGELAAKRYWKQFEQSPDFVVLFIPGDQFLSAALERDPGLLEEAMQQKVILATPTSLVALLRAVAYGWRQESLAENAEKIRQVGEELYGRLATFADHFGRVGKSLNQSVQHYNKAVASFDTRVLPGVRKFSEMGIRGKKAVEPATQIETAPRETSALEPLTAAENPAEPTPEHPSIAEQKNRRRMTGAED